MLPYAPDMPLQGFGTRIVRLGVLIVHKSRKRHLGVDYRIFSVGIMQNGIGNHPLPGLFVQDGFTGTVA